jgi:N-methylhydantoinase B
MPAGATEIFAEGLRIPPVKLRRGGTEDRDVVALLLANTRTPRERLGDLRAQAGANHLAGERLRELAAALGLDLLSEAMGAVQDHAERATRGAIAKIPDGTYVFEDVMDDDGAGREDVAIRASVTVRGDALSVDFEGTSPQVRGSINAPFAVTLSCCAYALRALTDPEIPANGGSYRALEVRAPRGSLLNPEPPAAVAAGNVETSQRIVDVVLGAMAKALPDLVPAASQGTMNNVLIGGMDASGVPFSYYETIAGGQGACPDANGPSAVHVTMTNTLNTPVEALELAYPLRVERYSLRLGSGGGGRFRGGDGVVRSIRVLEECRLSVVTERRSRAPQGARGGDPGAAGRNLLNGEELAAKATRSLVTGDVVTIETPGGGGFEPG